MKTETIAFSLASFLLFFTFINHIEEKLPYALRDSLDNEIAFASLAVTTPPYIALPELPISNYLDNPLEINAKSFRISFVKENNDLFSFEDGMRWPIASLTKLLTSVVAIEKLSLNQIIKIELDDILTEGSALNLKTGEMFSVKDLITAMLTVSSNDSANALARAYSYKDFIQSMNDKAFAIGMRSSSFFDPTGLSVLNQSTARDLEKLANYIFKNYPELFTISRNKENFIIELGTRQTHKLTNINKFAGNLDFIGGKTGYIEEARGNLLSIFNWNNRNILIIILGSEDRFTETSKLYNWVKDRLK